MTLFCNPVNSTQINQIRNISRAIKNYYGVKFSLPRDTEAKRVKKKR